MPDFRVSGSLTMDSSNFLRSMEAVDRSIKKTERDVRSLSRQLDVLDAKSVDIEVNVDGLDTIAALEAELDSLRDEKVTIEADVDSAAAFAELEALDAEVKRLNGKDVNIKTDRSSDNFSQLGSSAMAASGLIAGSGRGSLISSLLLLSTALAPMTVAVAGWGAGLLGATTVALGGFGAFIGYAIPGLKRLSTALSNNKKAIEDFPKPIQDVVKSWRTFQDLMQKTSKEFNPHLFNIVATGIDALAVAFKGAKPAAFGTARALERLMKDAKQGLEGKSWQNFFDYLGKTAQPIITKLGHALGNFLTGFINLIVALDPLTQHMTDSLLGLSNEFLHWSKTLGSNKAFQDFVNFVLQKGPMVWSTIKSIFNAAWQLATALEPLGEKVLNVAKAISDWIANFSKAHPGLVQFAALAGLIGIAVAPLAKFIIGIAGAIFSFGGAIAGALGPLATFMPFLAGPEGLAVVAGGLIAGGLLLLAAAVTAIGTALAFAVDTGKPFKHMWDSLKQTWDALKKTFNDVKQSLGSIWDNVKPEVARQFQKAIADLSDTFRELLPVLGPIAILVGGKLLYSLLGAAVAIRGLAAGVKGAVQGFKFFMNSALVVPKAIVAAFKWLYNVLVGHSIIPNMVNSIIRWFHKLTNLGAIAHRIGAKISHAFNAAKARAIAIFHKITAGIRKALNSARKVVGNVVNAIKNKIQAGFHVAVNVAVRLIRRMAAGVRNGVHNVLAAVRTIPGRIKGFFAGAGSWLYSAGARIIHGLISGIQSAIGGIRSVLSSVTGMIPNWKGPESVDKKLLFDSGSWIMQGLVKGIQNQQSGLKSALSDVTKTIANQGMPQYVASGTVAGGTAGRANGGIGGRQEVVVRLLVEGGDSEFKKMIRKSVRVDGRGSVQKAFGQ